MRVSGPARLVIVAATAGLILLAWQQTTAERLLFITWLENQYFEPKWAPLVALGLVIASVLAVCVGLAAWIVHGFDQPHRSR